MQKFPSLRLGHLTDLHLRDKIPGPPSLAARRGRELFQRLPLLFNQLVQDGCQAIAVTGDILDCPRWLVKDREYYDYNFTAWEKWVLSDYLRFFEITQSCPIPVLVLPGNHDHPQLFRQVFGRSRQPIKIRGRDFHVFADWPYRTSEARRLDIEKKCFEAALKHGKKGQVHLQHYVLAPNIEARYPYNFHRATDLVDAILSSGKVDLCLSGHYHQGAESILQAPAGTVAFYTGRALCESPFPFTVYQLEGGKIEKEIHELGMEEKKAPAIFIERDGCLIRDATFSSGPGDVILFDGVGEALATMQKSGFRLVVKVNNAAVESGTIHKDIVYWVNDEISRQLGLKGAVPNGYYGFSVSENRRWGEDYLKKAERELNIDLRASVLVSNKISDCLRALQTGLRAFLVRTGGGGEEESRVLQSGGIQFIDSLAELPAKLEER